MFVNVFVFVFCFIWKFYFVVLRFIIVEDVFVCVGLLFIVEVVDCSLKGYYFGFLSVVILFWFGLIVVIVLFIELGVEWCFCNFVVVLVFLFFWLIFWSDVLVFFEFCWFFFFFWCLVLLFIRLFWVFFFLWIMLMVYVEGNFLEIFLRFCLLFLVIFFWIVF